MAVKFDQVRAGHKDEAEKDSYTPVMTVSHRFGPIWIWRACGYGDDAYMVHDDMVCMRT